MNYWNQLNQRERWMVSLTAAILSFYLFYILVFSPLKTTVAFKSNQLIEKADTLKWMQQASLREHSTHKKQKPGNSQLLTLLANKLKKSNLHSFPYQIQQTTNGDIQLSFNTVPFNRFMSWLKTMNNQYAMIIKQIHIERQETAGMVKLLLGVSASKS